MPLRLGSRGGFVPISRHGGRIAAAPPASSGSGPLSPPLPLGAAPRQMWQELVPQSTLLRQPLSNRCCGRSRDAARGRQLRACPVIRGSLWSRRPRRPRGSARPCPTRPTAGWKPAAVSESCEWALGDFDVHLLWTSGARRRPAHPCDRPSSRRRQKDELRGQTWWTTSGRGAASLIKAFAGWFILVEQVGMETP